MSGQNGATVGGRRPGGSTLHPKARCIYCGRRLTYNAAKARPRTCGSHSDLPACDPHYMADLGGRWS